MRKSTHVLGMVVVVFGLLGAVACGGGDDADDDAPTAQAATATRPSVPPGATGTPTTTPASPTATATATPSPTPTSTPTATPTPTPIPTVDDTPPLVIVASNGGPLGGTASVTIQTAAGTTCSMVLVLPNGTPTNVPGIDPQEAGPDGRITWTWTLDPSYPTGSAQAQVTCERSRRAAIIEITP